MQMVLEDKRHLRWALEAILQMPIKALALGLATMVVLHF